MDMSENYSEIGPDEFKAALSRFASGVSVVTSVDGEGRDHGITVSAFASVSLRPPMILICIDKKTGSHGSLMTTESFAVSVLADGQEELSNRFASRMPDRFESVACHRGDSGCLILDAALVALECRTAHRYDGGDHTIFVAIVEKTLMNDESPLIYWRGDYRRLGA
jgi:flavin reductase (DIM6/NTAB) family NADH-FMN oxidoreductase RutF